MIIKVNLVALGFLLLCSCNPPEMSSTAKDDLRRSVLSKIENDIIIPSLQSALSEGKALESAVQQWAENPSGTNVRQVAQLAFQKAYVSWQRSLVMQVGPGGSAASFVGGLGLAENINSWPMRNNCRVDLVLLDKKYDEPNYFPTALVTAKSFVALEYLLFEKSNSNACDASNPMNVSGAWNQMGASEVDSRRAHYGAKVAANIALDLNTLLNTQRDSYAPELANAGKKGGRFQDTNQALNEVFHALMAFDSQVKDLKLAAPLGIKMCGTTKCEAETPLAQVSKKSVQQNILGLRMMLFAGMSPSGNGFDALLSDANAPEVTQTLVKALDLAELKLSLLPDNLSSAAVSHATEMNEALLAFRGVSNVLKNQFITVLNFSLPAEGAGDND
jgi:predicted lipoprotein